MPRDADALKIEKWAESGDVATPESQGLVRATGWPSSYSQAGGDLPKREVLNQILREWTALGVEVNQHGLLEWDSTISYAHPAIVIGSDDQVYLSVADSLGVDPTTDTVDASWTLLAEQGPVGDLGPVGPTSQFTYETLDNNGDVGTGATQVAQGDHGHTVLGVFYGQAANNTTNRNLVILTSGTYTTLITITIGTNDVLTISGQRYLVAGSIRVAQGNRIVVDTTTYEWRIRRADHPGGSNAATIASGSFDITTPATLSIRYNAAVLIGLDASASLNQRYQYTLEARGAANELNVGGLLAADLHVARLSF